MKLYLLIILILAFVPLVLGQIQPSGSPEKTFGFRLEKYKNKKPHNSQEMRNSRESDSEEIIKVKTDLVVNDILVTDQNGNIITELKKDDFIVTEDGVPQTIEIFSLGENASVPRSIVLILDNSVVQLPYRKNTIQASKILIDKLNPNDKVAIVSDKLKLLTDFTQNKNLLKNTLDSFETKHFRVWSGWEFSNLLAVSNEIFTAKDRHRIIIFQGNGNQSLRFKPDADIPYQISKSVLESKGISWNDKDDFGFSDVKEGIEKSRATVYSIIPGIQVLGLSKTEQLTRARLSYKNFRRAYFSVKDELTLTRSSKNFQYVELERMLAGQTAMFKTAELSGGSTYFIEKPEDAENVYSNIFKQIENRYIIGYYPTNQEQDGKLRNINIKIKGHPEYIVTGRNGYLP